MATYKQAIGILIALIGLAASVQGLVNSSGLAAINAVTPILIYSLLIAFCAWFPVAFISDKQGIKDDETVMRRGYLTLGAGFVGGLVWFFAVDGPISKDVEEFGLLSVLGILVILAGCIAVADELRAHAAAREKTCPDCGKQVPKPARICHYCRYDFETGQRGYGPAVQP